MKYDLLKLSEVAEINPGRPALVRADSAPTSFIPMESVDEMNGSVEKLQIQPFAKVKKGYTYFENGDVIFAKITPCMQNGKHAIVRALIDGFGFGSTEFHVIRASKRVTPEWVHYFLRSKGTIDAAEKTFTGAVGQQRVPDAFIRNIAIPLPDLAVQQQMVALLSQQLFEVAAARVALLQQQRDLGSFANAVIRNSLTEGETHAVSLRSALTEVTHGVGDTWKAFPVFGATRAGLARAKELPGKTPHRYKPVTAGTVFYNPMRILIGSIAFVDDDDKPGITSPDYVVLKGKPGVVDSRWFYYWLRSPLGERCIQSLARGAVRERMLFNRLAEGEIELPDFDAQVKASKALAQIKPMRAAIKQQIAELELLPQKLLAQIFES